MIHMFQWYQNAIITPNFSCFAYVLICNTHSSSMSPMSPFLPCFKFYLHPQQFQHFQLLFFSSSFSTFFHAFAITHIENKKVLEYNQMVNAKFLIMLDCKQLSIWVVINQRHVGGKKAYNSM